MNEISSKLVRKESLCDASTLQMRIRYLLLTGRLPILNDTTVLIFLEQVCDISTEDFNCRDSTSHKYILVLAQYGRQITNGVSNALSPDDESVELVHLVRSIYLEKCHRRQAEQYAKALRSKDERTLRYKYKYE